MRMQQTQKLASTWTCAMVLAVYFGAESLAHATPEEKVAECGEQLADALNRKDRNDFAKLIDLHALGLRVAKDMDLPERSRSEFAEGIALGGRKAIIDQTIEQLSQRELRAKMMNVVSRGSENRAVVRFDLGDAGLDYAEYIMVIDSKGTCRVIDWFQLSIGQLISSAIGTAGRFMVDPNPGMLRSLFGGIDVDEALMVRIRAVGTLERENKLLEAITAIDKLPEPIAKSRLLMMKRVQLAQQVDDDALYRKTLADLAAHHRDDPAAAFLLIDHFYFEKQFDRMLASIDTIQKRVGADGLTESLKAGLLHSVGDFERAAKHAANAVRLEPDRMDSYTLLASVQIANAQYEDAVLTFQSITKNFDYEFNAEKLKEQPEMEKFVRSVAFKKWMSKR